MVIKQPTDPIAVEWLIMLIYGQPGVRKTSFSFSSKNPLLLDFDNGVKRVGPKYRGAYVPIKTWDDTDGLFETKTDLSSYDTIIIDTAGKALEVLSLSIMKGDSRMKRKDGALTQQGFGALAQRFKEFMTRLRDLGKHIVLIAHDKETKSGDETMIRPDVTGSTASNIMREVDLCGYMRSHNGKSTITFNPSDNFYGKNTCGLPEFMEVDGVKLSDVIELALKNMNDDTEIYKQYLDQIHKVQTALSVCENADDLNEAKEVIMQIDFISDVKMQAANLMKEKAAALKCVIDKVTKRYQDATSSVPA
ncbi:ATP-binding protein [Dyadobacter sp. 3J3]|uniref:ATP-binding protein n=1 Tax=Dyadobacter sp. 3J3 TaxID=2606600 RepID=UPI0013595523|nr:ATP-binding protein [Dyadobacter sp. 3J3]